MTSWLGGFAAALLVAAVSPRDSRQDSAGVATVVAGPRQAVTVWMLEPGMHACMRWTETATARSVFENSNDANVKRYIHGDCVVRLCTERRLFGVCVPGTEMAGAAGCVCLSGRPRT